MEGSVGQALASGHRQMLKVGSPADYKKFESGEIRREIGQCFDWALDKARINKGAAAAAMGYSDQTILSRWIAGTERVQLDKCKLLGDEFFREFVIALAQTCQGVSVTTQINLQRTA